MGGRARGGGAGDVAAADAGGGGGWVAGHGAAVQVMSLLLTLVAALFVAHAMGVFYIRRVAIRKREVRSPPPPPTC